jgi:hypothetical protein
MTDLAVHDGAIAVFTISEMRTSARSRTGTMEGVESEAEKDTMATTPYPAIGGRFMHSSSTFDVTGSSG